MLPQSEEAELSFHRRWGNPGKCDYGKRVSNKTRSDQQLLELSFPKHKLGMDFKIVWHYNEVTFLILFFFHVNYSKHPFTWLTCSLLSAVTSGMNSPVHSVSPLYFP